MTVLSLVVPTEEVSAAECIDPDEEDFVEEEEEEMCSSVTGGSGSCGEEVEEEEEERDAGFPLLFAIKLSRFKIQGQFVSGGTTFSEYPHGGITLSELTWRAHWTKLTILNQHARGGITEYKKITQPLNKN